MQSSPPAEEITKEIDHTISNAASNEASLRKTAGTLEEATYEAEQIIHLVQHQGWGGRTAERTSVEAVRHSVAQRAEQAKREITHEHKTVYDVSPHYA